jgi:hypothetical protein
MADQRPVEHEESQDGYEKVLADYEKELARYLQARIKPGLSRSAIPLMARSIAKEIAAQHPPEQIGGSDVPEAGGGPAPDFEADMHELQAPARRRMDPALLGPRRGRLADRREAGLEPARRGGYGRAAREDRRGDAPEGMTGLPRTGNSRLHQPHGG